MVVVVFFGTWAANAKNEIPHLVKLHEEWAAKGVSVIGIAYELGKTDDATHRALREYVEKKGVKYPVVLVGKDDPVLKKMPDGDQFPSKLFVDRDGKVRAAEVGYQPYEALEALVLALVEGPKPVEKKPEEKQPEEKKPEEKREGVDEPI